MEPHERMTERQREVYEFVRDKIRNRGYGVMCHLKALEKKGLIRREPNMSRAIQLAAEPLHERGLPLAGRIAAGVLHEAVEQDQRVEFDELFDSRNKNLFVLQVHGDSMIDDQIADGDYVVIRKQRTARRGQIVVALTEENEATLKRWYPERNRIRLEPANARMKPIYVKNARILGVVVGVVRKVE
jgi:repressor LexA